MAINDFYRILYLGGMNFRNFANEFWYRQTSGAGGAYDLSQGFLDTVAPAIQAVQTSQAGYNQLKVYNHTVPTDFVELEFPYVAGVLGGDLMPSFVCYGFKCARKRTDMRSGSKRISGVPEGYGADGNISSTSILNALQTLASMFSIQITEGSSAWMPVIVRRTLQTFGDKQYYAPPVTISSSDYYTADGWSVSPRLTSQNSRKS